MKQRIFFGLAPLFILLLVMGGYAVSLFARLGNSVDVILRENFRSVVAGQQMKETAERMADFIARRTKQAEDKIALAEAQATAEVRAAAADHAAKAAEIVLTDQMHGPAGADLVGREIGDLKNRLS